MQSGKKQYKKFKKREPTLTIEQKVEKFVIRNSQNGFFTKVSTISYKFEVSEEKSWDIVGELLSNGMIEAVHDDHTGEMKLCEIEKTYKITELEWKRRKEKHHKNYKKQRDR